MNTEPYEKYLIDTVLPQLEQGRPGWDKPHTVHVVEYVKKIIDNEPTVNTDKDALVVVAYLHDYGYMFFKDVLKSGPTKGIAKTQHAKKSAEYWTKIQDNEVFSAFSDTQKERINHLIVVHDEVEHLHAHDELLFMEADTLGALAMGNFQNIDNDVYQKYLNSVEQRRITRFVTDYAKAHAEKFIAKARK